jgi:rhodanese-related sulfurtransferase
MSNETVDTLGHQKKFNYALDSNLSKEAFVEQVLQGLVAPPQYFPKNAVMNKSGYDSIDDILGRGVTGLDARQFMDMIRRSNAIVLDTRPSEAFIHAFIPGSIWIGIDDSFAPWVGALIEDLTQPIVFLAEPGREEEVVTRLARVGYDHAAGYLEGGIQTWKEAGFLTDEIKSIGPHDFTGMYDLEYLHVLDVRKKSEYDSQHIEGTLHFPLDTIYDRIIELDKNTEYYIHCQGGYRSVIAASILKSEDFNVINIEGGLNEIKKSCVKLTEYKEPMSFL